MYYAESSTSIPAQIGSINTGIKDLGFISAEATIKGNVLLTIKDNYGAPHIFKDINDVYLRNNDVVQQTKVHYSHRPAKNVKIFSDYVIMTDGKFAYIVNDNNGEVERTYDLVSLGGQEDNYFVEGVGNDFLLIRPNKTGVLMLVDPLTEEKVFLYKKLLSELEQEYAETNDVPFRGDRLEFIEKKDDTLYFKNNSQLLEDSTPLYQYVLPVGSGE